MTCCIFGQGFGHTLGIWTFLSCTLIVSNPVQVLVRQQQRTRMLYPIKRAVLIAQPVEFDRSIPYRTHHVLLLVALVPTVVANNNCAVQ
jgi:hypothetical protein